MDAEGYYDIEQATPKTLMRAKYETSPAVNKGYKNTPKQM